MHRVRLMCSECLFVWSTTNLAVAAPCRFRVPVASGLDLRTVLFSHGWIDLEPFDWDEATGVFSTPVDLDGVAVDVTCRQTTSGLAVVVDSRRALSRARRASARDLLPYMLRLDECLDDFWAKCAQAPRLAWVSRRGAGRIFRAPSVFEDLIKLLFTTNCSWAATRLMTSRLVEALGVRAPSGRQAFPTAAACAAQDEAFYRDVVRAGYRAKSCVSLAGRFASGELYDDWFTDRALSLDQVRDRLLSIAGFGPYAAGQAMRLLGHYKDLALDSWCRAKLSEMAGNKPGPSDQAVAKRYARFDPFDGLALWMDLTADWFDEV